MVTSGRLPSTKCPYQRAVLDPHHERITASGFLTAAKTPSMKSSAVVSPSTLGFQKLWVK